MTSESLQIYCREKLDDVDDVNITLLQTVNHLSLIGKIIGKSEVIPPRLPVTPEGEY